LFPYTSLFRSPGPFLALPGLLGRQRLVALAIELFEPAIDRGPGPRKALHHFRTEAGIRWYKLSHRQVPGTLRDKSPSSESYKIWGFRGRGEGPPRHARQSLSLVGLQRFYWHLNHIGSSFDKMR